jgi:hypothetical protein
MFLSRVFIKSVKSLDDIWTQERWSNEGLVKIIIIMKCTIFYASANIVTVIETRTIRSKWTRDNWRSGTSRSSRNKNGRSCWFCSLIVEPYVCGRYLRRFGGTFCLHIRPGRWRQHRLQLYSATTQHAVSIFRVEGWSNMYLWNAGDIAHNRSERTTQKQNKRK